MSSPSLPESEGSTSDSNEPVIESSRNVKPTPTPGKSSGDTGPTSRSTKTSADSTANGWQAWDSLNDAATDLVPTMGQNTGTATGRAGVIFQNQKAAGFSGGQGSAAGGIGFREGEAPTLKAAASGSNQVPLALISSAEDSPARTSPSPENGQDSPGNAPACSSRPPESLTLFSGMEDGFSLRMFPDSFPQMGELTSGSFSRRWPTSGFTTSPGECWTADTSECHNDGGAFSSLPDVLEADVPPRFYLSPRAAAGIIRRAEKRGRSLPRELDRALTELARLNHSAPGSETPGQTSPMRKPGGSSPAQPSAQNTENPQDKTSGNPEPSSPMAVSENQRAEVRETPYARQLTTGEGKPGQGYPTIRDGQTVRRLTPTECERLQGFPDGWTIP